MDDDQEKADKSEPDFNKALDIKAFMLNKLGFCGCCEIKPMLETIEDFLNWVEVDRI